MRNGHTTIKLMTCSCGTDIRTNQTRRFRGSTSNIISYIKRRKCWKCGQRWEISQIAYHDPECAETRPCYDSTHLRVTKKWNTIP